MPSASEPPDGLLAGTLDDLAQAHRVHGDELAGHRKAEAVLFADDITVVCTISSPDGREQTALLRLTDDGEIVWQRGYESGAGRAIAAHPDGGCVVAGDSQRGALEYEALLMRLDADGALVAELRFGHPGATGFTSVTVLADGLPLAGGMERGRGYLVAGDGAWQQVLDDTAGVTGVAALGDGGFALAATQEPSTTALGMTRLAAFGSDRAERWARRLPEAGRGEPAGIVALRDGGVVVVGHRAPDGQDAAQLWAARVDAGGRPEWERLLGSEGEEQRGRAVAALDGGDVAVAGDATRDGRRGVRVARLGAGGATVWQQAFDDSEQDVALGLAATADGGLVLVGSTLEAGSGKTQACVRRLDGEGRLLWMRAC